MVLRDLITDVFRTLWSHKLRTFLTMFGIAWGIVSIVLMVAAGEGLRKGQEDQSKTLGKRHHDRFSWPHQLAGRRNTSGASCSLGRCRRSSGAGRRAGLPICDSGARAGR